MDAATLKDITARYECGETPYQIAIDVGMSGPGIAYWLTRNGVVLRPKGHFRWVSYEDRAQAIRAAYEAGASVKQVAAQLKVSSATVCEAISSFDIARPKVKRKKLSSDQESEVVRLYLEGWSYRELENKFSVCHAPIAAALKQAGIQPRVGWAKYRTVKWTDRKDRSFIFKSTWELAFAKWLDSRGVDWEYETLRFALKTCRRYTPDFVINAGPDRWLAEIHGWLDAPTERRLIEFRQTYPNESLEVLGPAEMASLGLIEPDFAKHPMAAKVTGLRERLEKLDALDA